MRTTKPTCRYCGARVPYFGDLCAYCGLDVDPDDVAATDGMAAIEFADRIRIMEKGDDA